MEQATQLGSDRQAQQRVLPAARGLPELDELVRQNSGVELDIRETVPKERLDPWLFTHKDTYRDPNDLPDLAALQRNLKTQKEAGFLKIDIDVKKFADLSLVKEAGRRVNGEGKSVSK